MTDTRLRLSIHGVVQGVGFRWFVQRAANQMNLTGWARNEPDGSVTVEVEGDSGLVKAFIDEIKTGNRYAHVTRIDEQPVELKHELPPLVIKY